MLRPLSRSLAPPPIITACVPRSNRQRTKDEYLEENADQLAARLTELQNMHRSGRVLSPASAVGKGTGGADAAMSDEELDRRLAEAKAATTILEENLQKEKDKWSTLMQAEREAIETAMENNKDTRADLTCKLLSSVQALTVLGGGHLVGVDAIRRLDTNLGPSACLPLLLLAVACHLVLRGPHRSSARKEGGGGGMPRCTACLPIFTSCPRADRVFRPRVPGPDGRNLPLARSGGACAAASVASVQRTRPAPRHVPRVLRGPPLHLKGGSTTG